MAGKPRRKRKTRKAGNMVRGLILVMLILPLMACRKAETPAAPPTTATGAVARSAARTATETVPVSVSGIVGITTGVPVLYLGQWAFQQTEFGFFWLDTSALTGGHIQAISRCVGGFPPSNSALYVIADCNSITLVGGSLSQGIAQVLVTSGQCGAQTRGCAGPRDDGHWIFNFDLGSWGYHDSDTPLQANDPPNQQSDPQGRTWKIRPTDGTNRNFAWTTVGEGPTPPPITPPPTQQPRTATPTNPPLPTATPCVNVPYGRVGPFGYCYDCAGNVVDGTPVGGLGTPCGPPPTRPPIETPTTVPTAIPTGTPTSVPTSTVGSPTPCVIRSGELVIVGPCGR